MERNRPLKKFGQNYLTDKNILRKIVNEISPEKNDNIIEIGPGTGSLTEFIYEKNQDFTAIDIDTRVIENLQRRFPGLNIIQGDFLEMDLYPLYNSEKKKIRITGNIPYNITSPIIFKIIFNSKIISDAVLLVQDEVAKRMTAEKGSKDYGILSVLLKYFSEVKYCFKISPNVFYPKPKVFSAAVHIFLKKEFDKNTDDLFIKIVKAAFGKRRKILKNSLGSSIFENINFSDSGIDLNKRAEQLDLDDFIRLSEFVRSLPGSPVLTE